jgi:hypothetical protein
MRDGFIRKRRDGRNLETPMIIQTAPAGQPRLAITTQWEYFRLVAGNA